jgi:peptidoglycan/xylan/chitin deacetylase (PgdA/CDA1 family)
MSVIKTFMRKAFMVGTRYSGVSQLLSPSLSGVGAVLMLHHVRPEAGGVGLNRHLHVTPEFLEQLIGELKRGGSRFVSMDEAADRLRSGHFDERFLAVTLDDGYRDNLQYAAPVFRSHGVPYTVYVSPGLTDGTADLWWEHLEMVVERNDEVVFEGTDGPETLDCRTYRQKRYAFCVLLEHATKVLDEDAQREFSRVLSRKYGIDRDSHRRETLLTWDEIGGLVSDRLASIGAHTVNHFHLRRLPRERAFGEIVKSADAIETKLGRRPAHFAFPYGHALAAGEREVAMAREAGFSTAVTTRHGVLVSGHASNMHALPRISVNGYYQRVGYVQTMLTGITTPAANYGRKLVTV